MPHKNNTFRQVQAMQADTHEKHGEVTNDARLTFTISGDADGTFCSVGEAGVTRSGTNLNFDGDRGRAVGRDSTMERLAQIKRFCCSSFCFQKCITPFPLPRPA